MATMNYEKDVVFTEFRGWLDMGPAAASFLELTTENSSSVVLTASTLPLITSPSSLEQYCR